MKRKYACFEQYNLGTLTESWNSARPGDPRKDPVPVNFHFLFHATIIRHSADCKKCLLVGFPANFTDQCRPSVTVTQVLYILLFYPSGFCRPRKQHQFTYF